MFFDKRLKGTLFVISTIIGIFGASNTYAEINKSKNKIKKPNFLWLISEDNSQSFLDIYNPGGAEMQSVDFLAKNGLIFENAYANTSASSASRTTLALGAHGTRLGASYHRVLHKTTLPTGLIPLSKVLKNAGYYTTNHAKEDYNFLKVGEIWDESSKKSTWTSRDSGQPFFHVQTFNITHEAVIHFPESNVGNIDVYHDPKKVNVYPWHPDTSIFRYTYARYLDKHSALDYQLKDVIDRLERDGLLEDTFIFYFGDNGGSVPGSKGYLSEAGIKIPLVIRIPKNYRHLMGEGIVGTNQRVNGLVSFVDFAATLVNLAGLEERPQHDGTAFLGPKISLSQLESRDFVYTYADRFDEKIDFLRSIRSGNFKYIRSYTPFYPDALHNDYRFKQAAYREWRDLFNKDKLTDLQARFFHKKPIEQLYDLSVDPNETKNLAINKIHFETLKKMRTLLRKNQIEQGDLGFYPESYLVKNAINDTEAFFDTHSKPLIELMDIADWVFEDRSTILKHTHELLKTGDTWEKYWAINVLSSLGEAKNTHIDLVKKLLMSKEAPLIRAKALEFLAIIGEHVDFNKAFSDIYKQSSDIEIIEVLHIAAFLKQEYHLAFDVPSENANNIKLRHSLNQFQRDLFDEWFENRVRFLSSE